VAGVAAVVKSYLGSGATSQDVRSAIESTADQTGALGQNMLAWTQHGRVNLYNALTNSAPPSPPPPPPSGSSVHIGDLDATRINQGSTWQARITITSHDVNHAAQSGAVVYATWSGGYSGAVSCITNSSGQCNLTTASMRKKVGSVTLTITSVQAADTYEAGDNHDPDSDSNGTVITVFK